MWSKTQEAGDALVAVLYRAYFVHNRNLAEETVLLDAVKEDSRDPPKGRSSR